MMARATKTSRPQAQSANDLFKAIRDTCDGIKSGVKMGFETLAELKSMSREYGFGRPDAGQGIDVPGQAAKNPCDPWQILGCEPDEPPELIKQVAKVKLRFYHPDTSPVKGGMPDRLQRFLNAWSIIQKELKKG
jgi:hypothetical protein